VRSCLEPTYEGLKVAPQYHSRSSSKRFGAYLWGIERGNRCRHGAKSAQVWSLPMRDWKAGRSIQASPSLIVWSLPMRDWKYRQRQKRSLKQ